MPSKDRLPLFANSLRGMLVLAMLLLTEPVCSGLLRMRSNTRIPPPIIEIASTIRPTRFAVLRISRGFLGGVGVVPGVTCCAGVGVEAVGVWIGTAVAAATGVAWVIPANAGGVDRTASANNGVGAGLAGLGVPPFTAYGTPGLRKLLFSTVVFLCVSPHKREYLRILVYTAYGNITSGRRNNVNHLGDI